MSVPEGDDKVLKYPLMFSVSDVLLVNKIDYLDGSDFNLVALRRRAQNCSQSAPRETWDCRAFRRCHTGRESANKKRTRKVPYSAQNGAERCEASAELG